MNHLSAEDLYAGLIACNTCLPAFDGLATRFDCEPLVLMEAINEAYDAGMVGVWHDLDGVLHVHFTSLATERLGLYMTDEAEPRWCKKKGQFQRVDRDPAVFMVDQEDNQYALAIAIDAKTPHERGREWDAENPPPMWHILGIDVQWPTTRLGPSLPGVCPGCHDRPLGLHTVCVVTDCHRSGFDRTFDAHWKRHSKPRQVQTSYTKDGKLKGGVGA